MKGGWSRREFLIAVGALLAGCRPTSRDVAPTAYVAGSGNTPQPTPTTFKPPPAGTAQAVPVSVPVTDVDHFYIKTYRQTTHLTNLSDYTLQIDGMVEHPLTLTFDEIHALPAVESMRTLECIGNPVGGGLVGNVIWKGAPLDVLLVRAGIKPGATHASFEAADGYKTTVELKWITQPDVLLAYEINGGPLPVDHGFPLRILMPGLYGQKMPKWITRITFTDHDSLGYWEGPAYGWSNLAAVKTNSRFYTPDRNVKFTSPMRVEGMAYGGTRKITRVEVSLNGAGKDAVWQPATIIAPPSPLAWTWWVYDWAVPTPGSYQLAVRATDERGSTQSEPANGLMAGAYPDGTGAIHVLSVNVTP